MRCTTGLSTAKVWQVASSGGRKGIGPDELKQICAERKAKTVH